MKKTIFISLIMMLVTGYITSQEEIKLYPKGAEESNELQREESWRDADFIRDISDARMYSYLVSKEKSNGTAVLICPGGGYGGLSINKEGSEIAKWLNEKGISAFVLYYRMPNSHQNIPLKDAKTALSIIRNNAKKWNIDRKKIGIMGFSAGGHLASTVGTHFKNNDERPDFMILIYPVISMSDEITHKASQQNLLGKDASQELKDEFSNELHITKNTPPTFLVHAKDDDAVSNENSKRFYRALLKNKVRAEFQLYQKGGHGFGMRPKGVDSDEWSQKLSEWLKSENLSK